MCHAARRGHAVKKTYSSREIIAILRKGGWVEVAQEGSHKQFKHPSKPGRITVPHPERTVKKGTAHSVFKAAGIRPPRK
jgi:predicted RNA binding protein YcfA (HicA-like mRNA interferase family)